MSTRQRRRRSELELLEEARSILFADESDPEDQPDQPDDGHQTPAGPDRAPDGPDEPGLTDRPDEAGIQMEQMNILAQALQQVGRASFKPPTFCGEEDVELFIRQFGDVADANRWSDLERTLHLRSQLQGDAQSCGQGEDYQEITDDLRARYGTSRRQARDKLSTFQLRAGQSVHKQAGEINRLVKLAFPMLPDREQQSMALDYFSRGWEDRAVQEHLLAIRPTNVREAVRATEDFLTIHTGGSRPRAHVVERAPVDDSAQATSETGLAIMAEAIKAQTALLQQILLQMGTTQAQPAGQPSAAPRQPLKCYDCGGPHLKRNCPRRQASSTQNRQPAGNGNDPAQD